MTDTLYLDNNATTRVAPEVREAILPFLGERYGNPSSPHHFGGSIEADLTLARNRLASLVGCSPKEIFFTSGGTESDNLAIRGILASHPDRRHIVTTQVEHSAVLVQCRELEKQGFRVTYLPVDSDGGLKIADLEEAIDEETALVSIMWANNETGVIFPIEEISRVCREREVPLHVDGVQAVGKIPVNLANTSIDLMAISGHKFHAPKGVGAIYIRSGFKIKPLFWGGNQERGRRPGTEPVPFIVGLGKAAQLAEECLDHEFDRIRVLRDELEKGFLKKIPEVWVNGGGQPRLPNTLSACFEGVEGEALLMLMDQNGIAASSGSACLSHRLEPSHVLLAMGVPEEIAKGAVRLGLSRYTENEEIERVLEVMPGLVEKARRLSKRMERG
ncbi:MAG: cysteine desulfurase NifS [Candidatus Omnitrophica bacterium]|nr:cysteine desulfurase NifS [Candidatus Omnitrophota bacterium]